MPRSVGCDINSFVKRYDLCSEHVYLLELLPLIAVMWADGRNQPAEMAILQHFTVKHLAYLNTLAGGENVVDVSSANRFIERFTQAPPNSAMLSELGVIVKDHLSKTPTQTRTSILDACLDIAAACASSYPYPLGERINREEKASLKALIDALFC